MYENSYIVSMFQQSLERLVEKIDGGLAGLVIGFNGVYVDFFVVDPPPPIEFPTLSRHSSSFLTQVAHMASLLKMGALQECAIQTEKYNILLRGINQDYFLVLITVKTSFLARSKLFLELTALELRAKMGYEQPQEQS